MEQKKYNEYLNIVKKVTKNDELSYDLLHDILVQLSSNIKWNTLDDRQKKFFFIRTLTNQYYSHNSSFYKQYKKYQFQEIGSIEQLETEYEEQPTIDWIYETLDKELKEHPQNWYNVNLFKLYLELKKIDLIHKQTRIPKYSIRITIKEMKLFIQEKWSEYKQQ